MTWLYTTGGTGTIGRHLPEDVTRLNVDLSGDQTSFDATTFEKFSNLIHLAGVVGSSEVAKDVKHAQSVNVQGTKFLAEKFLKESVGKFHYISTSHVYAPSQKLIAESNKLDPISCYAEQKLEAEFALQDVFRAEAERLCIVRVFSVLDWDVGPFTLGGAIRKLSKHDASFILSNALDVRDFLTPKTIAKSLYVIAKGGKVQGIVNLCSGVGLTVGEAAKRMLSESQFEVVTDRFNWNNSENPVVVGDNSRLKSVHPSLNLTWNPSTYC